MNSPASMNWIEWCAAAGLGVAMLAVASVVVMGLLVWLAGGRASGRR